VGRIISIELRTAVEGLKADIVVSPTLLREIAEAVTMHDGWGGGDGEDDLIVELRLKNKGSRTAYRLVSIAVQAANEDLDPTAHRAPEYDNSVGFVLGNDEDNDG
jgi:hypothetical protein